MTHLRSDYSLEENLTELRIRYQLLKRDFLDLESIKNKNYAISEILIEEQINKYLEINFFDKCRDFAQNDKDVYLVQFSGYHYYQKTKDRYVTFQDFMYEKDSEAKEAIKQYITDNSIHYKERYYFDWVIKKPYSETTILPWNQRRYYSLLKPGNNWYYSDDSKDLSIHDKEQFDTYWKNNKYYINFHLINTETRAITEKKFFELKNSYDWEDLKDKIAIFLNSEKKNLGLETINKYGDILIFSHSSTSLKTFIFKDREYKGKAIVVGTNKSNLILNSHADVIQCNDYRLTDERYKTELEELKNRIVSFPEN